MRAILRPFDKIESRRSFGILKEVSAPSLLVFGVYLGRKPEKYSVGFCSITSYAYESLGAKIATWYSTADLSNGLTDLRTFIEDVMARYFLGLLMAAACSFITIWSVSKTLAGANQNYIEELSKMLPAKQYEGHECQIDVKRIKKWGVSQYSVKVRFGGDTESSFELTDSELTTRVTQFDHDNEKKHFLKISIAENPTESEIMEEKKLAVIHSRGQLAAVAVRDGLCVLK
jgi:hypothetical protein